MLVTVMVDAPVSSVSIKIVAGVALILNVSTGGRTITVRVVLEVGVTAEEPLTITV
jgi:hypothetical protein